MGDAFGQAGVVVTAKGVGDIFGGRVGQARDTAIEDALRNSVEQAVGTLLHSDSIVQNGRLIQDEIISNSRGYIKNFNLVEEEEEEHIYLVTVEAYVSNEQIQDDLAAIGLLSARKHKPRIMVVIPEFRTRDNRKRSLDPAGETEIIKKLLEKGFKVVDQSQIRKIRYNDQVRAAIDGDIELSKKLGLRYGAEIIIVGEAFSESQGRTYGNLVSSRAQAKARAIRTGTGEILVADSKTASNADISDTVSGKNAIQEAAGHLADYFIERILAKWSGDVTNMATVELVIRGLTYRQYVHFKNEMKKRVRGIKAIHNRSLTGKVIQSELEIKGTAQSLSEALMIADFTKYLVELTDFSANKIALNVRPR